MKNKKKLYQKIEIKGMINAMPFLLPSLIGLSIFFLLPVIISLILSMSNWDGLAKLSVDSFLKDCFVGLDNYKEILTGSEFYRVLGNTAYFIALYIPCLFVSSLGIAWLLNKSIKGVGFYRVVYYIPVLTSWIAASLIFKWLLAPQFGLMNNILAMMGVDGPAWLQSEVWAMPSIVLVSVWKDMGFYGLILLSGLKGIDKGYYESANIDGASGWKSFIKITLPLLSPSLFFVLVVSLINAFQLFPQIMIMTGGGPNGATQVMVERIYTYGFSYYKMGYASAISWILFLIIFIFTTIQMKIQKRWVHYE